MTFYLNGILVIDEQKVLTELEDEIADIIDNLFLQHLFVNIFNVIGI